MSKEMLFEHHTAEEAQQLILEEEAYIDAANLLIKDLSTRHDEIRHAAGFQNCEKQLDELKNSLITSLQRKVFMAKDRIHALRDEFGLKRP